jgi:hypothetical protein
MSRGDGGWCRRRQGARGPARTQSRWIPNAWAGGDREPARVSTAGGPEVDRVSRSGAVPDVGGVRRTTGFCRGGGGLLFSSCLPGAWGQGQYATPWNPVARPVGPVLPWVEGPVGRGERSGRAGPAQPGDRRCSQGLRRQADVHALGRNGGPATDRFGSKRRRRERTMVRGRPRFGAEHVLAASFRPVLWLERPRLARWAGVCATSSRFRGMGSHRRGGATGLQRDVEPSRVVRRQARVSRTSSSTMPGSASRGASRRRRWPGSSA